MYYRDRTTGEYPLTRYQVMTRNAVGNKIHWDESDLIVLNVDEVLPRATTTTPAWDQKFVRSQPENIAGKWYESWQLAQLSNEEKNLLRDQKWNEVRGLQRAILERPVQFNNQGDVIVPNTNVVIPYSQYATYLAQILALTSQFANPFDIQWPESPFVDPNGAGTNA